MDILRGAPIVQENVILAARDAGLVESVRTCLRQGDRRHLEVVADIELTTHNVYVSRADIVLVEYRGDDAESNVARAVAAHQCPVIALGVDVATGWRAAAERDGAVATILYPVEMGDLEDHIETLLRPARAQRSPATQARHAELLLGMDASMRPLAEQITRVAAQDSTILLGGETGSGKTRMARLIHDLSPRNNEPFLVVNCGALSSNLIESEMFGHVRGAFTGADRDRVGKFSEVGRGTLLLDEIDSLPLSLQAKLLRVVEDRVFEPVGSNKTLPVRARLIVASNRDLASECNAERFRSDLYYRLNVVGFTLPPLRQRPEVVSQLANRFLSLLAEQHDRPLRGFSPRALRALELYTWPGNVRELRNVIERAVVLSSGPEIYLEDLPPIVRGDEPLSTLPPRDFIRPVAPPPLERTLAEIRQQAELDRIVEALGKNKNNRRRAARDLGISRMTLYKKLYKYGLMTDDGVREPGVQSV
jgi:DNA-binding NtrC family response regulator